MNSIEYKLLTNSSTEIKRKINEVKLLNSDNNLDDLKPIPTMRCFTAQDFWIDNKYLLIQPSKFPGNECFLFIFKGTSIFVV